MVKILGIFGVLLLVFLAFVGFLYTAIWLLTKGIDERYNDVDTHSCSLEELQEIKNKVIKRKKQRHEEYLRRNINADIHNSGGSRAPDSKDTAPDI